MVQKFHLYCWISITMYLCTFGRPEQLLVQQTSDHVFVVNRNIQKSSFIVFQFLLKK